jgi:hypothetical protein
MQDETRINMSFSLIKLLVFVCNSIMGLTHSWSFKFKLFVILKVGLAFGPKSVTLGLELECLF